MKILAHNRLIANLNPKEVESSTKAIVDYVSKRLKLKVLGRPRITKVGSIIKTTWQIDNKVLFPLADAVYGELVIETEEGDVDYLLESNVNYVVTEKESGRDISIFIDRFVYDVHNDDLTRRRYGVLR